MRLLIVEDDPDSADVLCTYLRRSGHAADCCRNGSDALRAIIDHTPDVLVLDLMMPGMNGAGLLDVVRSYMRLHSLPAVVLTGHPDGPQADAARQLGVSAVLVKGTATPKDVLRAAERAVTPWPSSPPHDNPEPPSTSTPPPQ